MLLVVLGLALGYALGRALGLPPRLAVLVACGNAICGNSAIAAVAPVIDAEPEHVATAIAFTAMLGVLVVLGLPLLVAPLGLSFYQYGVLAGLTVYAVPQVLAAAFPVSALSGQVGTLVKLVRVLMLGPVVLFFALRYRGARARGRRAARRCVRTQLVPWFIVGFLALAALRSLGAVPAAVRRRGPQPSRASLTIAAMAALGLGVDVRAVSRVGRPVILTVTGSLARARRAQRHADPRARHSLSASVRHVGLLDVHRNVEEVHDPADCRIDLRDHDSPRRFCAAGAENRRRATRALV